MCGPRLTETQRKLLEFIQTHVAAHGYPPTVRDCLTTGLWTSTSSVAHQLRALRDKGYLTRSTRGARAYTITDGNHTEDNPMDIHQYRDAAIRALHLLLQHTADPQTANDAELETKATQFVEAAVTTGTVRFVMLTVGSEDSDWELAAAIIRHQDPTLEPEPCDIAAARAVIERLADLSQVTAR